MGVGGTGVGVSVGVGAGGTGVGVSVGVGVGGTGVGVGDGNAQLHDTTRAFTPAGPVKVKVPF